jgi:hypothetical protein
LRFPKGVCCSIPGRNIIRSRKDAIEKLNWYATRWKIETFHKILKSGCKAEDVKLRTAERLVNLIAILCLLMASLLDDDAHSDQARGFSSNGADAN